MRLRDDMDTFSGPHFAEMFARWRPPATKVIRAEIAAAEDAERTLFLRILPHENDRSGRVEDGFTMTSIERRGVNAAKKARSPQFRWRRSPKTAFGAPPTRAVRPGPWRIDPCFGVKGGAGATPVSVGCAATNPIRPRSAPSWVTPAPPPRVHCVFGHANRHGESTANQKEISNVFLHPQTAETRA